MQDRRIFGERPVRCVSSAPIAGNLYRRSNLRTRTPDQGSQERGNASRERAGSPGRPEGGDVPGGESRGGERSLEVVAPGVAVDVEHLADAVKILHGL